MSVFVSRLYVKCVIGKWFKIRKLGFSAAQVMLLLNNGAVCCDNADIKEQMFQEQASNITVPTEIRFSEVVVIQKGYI